MLALQFDNWTISAPSDGSLRQYDNLSHILAVKGNLPEGYTWDLLVNAQGHHNIIRLTPTTDGAQVTLTDDMLAFSGRYTVQLRGTLQRDEATTRHTNIISIQVYSSLSGAADWPKIPSEFILFERRISQAATQAQEHAQAAATAQSTAAAQAEASSRAAQQAALSAQQAQQTQQAIEDLEVSSVTLAPGQEATVTKSQSDDAVLLNFGIPQGPPGAQGISIQSIQRTSGDGSPGSLDTYTILLSDGRTSTFTIYNGTDASGDLCADGSIPMTGDLVLGGNRITQLAPPQDGQDAVRKSDLDAVAAQDGYLSISGTAVMGTSCSAGSILLPNIQGATFQSGVPSYDAPVDLIHTDNPLQLCITGKNLLSDLWALDQTTQAGVTCIRTGNSFSLEGTNTGATSINFYLNRHNTTSAFSLPAGTYTLSGMPTLDAPQGYELNLYRYTSEGKAVLLAYDNGLMDNERKIVVLDTAADNLFLTIRVGPAVNVDGLSIAPQLEVGNQATDYEAPRRLSIQIPLLNPEGQVLDPLRIAYTGRYNTAKTPLPDRIIRRNGLWYVERNTAIADLTSAEWGISTNYVFPYLKGDLVRGRESHFVLSSHFPAAGDSPSTVWTAGIWMGGGIAINKESLPNGTATTLEEIKTFCQDQSASGTPVIVQYALAQPEYQLLHRNVQALLNTLAVPGGVCSIWFAGNVLPTGADICLPRGDYPCSGMEGIYQWLLDLSSPLPTPTHADLHVWALQQQRGGAFATDETVTTQSTPEVGACRGLLLVLQPGNSLSMLAWAPSGQLYATQYEDGIWSAWSPLGTGGQTQPLAALQTRTSTGAEPTEVQSSQELDALLIRQANDLPSGSTQVISVYISHAFDCFPDGYWLISISKTGQDSALFDMHTCLTADRTPVGGRLSLSRSMTEGILSPWEFTDAPMEADVEYRTTARYLGKPVYRRLIPIGALPNHTAKTISFACSGEIAHILSATGCSMDGGACFPSASFGGIAGNEVSLTASNAGFLVVSTNSDQSMWTENYVELQYTKHEN